MSDQLTTELELEEALVAVSGYGELIEDTPLADARVLTFEEGGYLTHDRGLCVTMPDGTKFQITIIQEC